MLADEFIAPDVALVTAPMPPTAAPRPVTGRATFALAPLAAVAWPLAVFFAHPLRHTAPMAMAARRKWRLGLSVMGQVSLIAGENSDFRLFRPLGNAPVVAVIALIALLAAAPGAWASASRLDRRPLFVAFYVPWDDNARRSLAAHVGKIDVFAPLWISLTSPSGDLALAEDPQALATLAKARRAPAVLPLVSNAHDGVWDAAAAEGVILDAATRERFLARLADLARQHGYDGYVFDFEDLTPAAIAAYPAFLAQARQALAAVGSETWVAVPIGAAAWPLGELSSAADTVVLMAYDECWANSTPGPIAGEDWLVDLLTQRLPPLDPRRTVIALGAYGYDWPSAAPARVVSVADARALARTAGAEPTRDPGSNAEHFAYNDAAGRPHGVWYADAVNFAAQRGRALAQHPRGVALWRLGLEDAALWASLDRPPPAPAISQPGQVAPIPCSRLPVSPAAP